MVRFLGMAPRACDACYLARGGDRHVRLHVLESDGGVRAVFRRAFDEAHAITTLEHPNLARVLELGRDGKRYFFTSVHVDETASEPVVYGTVPRFSEPSALEPIVMRALARDPADRYQTALDLANELCAVTG